MLDLIISFNKSQKIFRCLLLGIALVSFGGCVTTDESEISRPPLITNKTPLAEAIDAAIRFGEKTLIKVKRVISRRHQWEVTAKAVRTLILKHHETWPSNKLVNAFALYQASNDSQASKVFEVLVYSERRLGRQLAWYLASQNPSSKMSIKIENRLTTAIVDNDLSELYLPYMADAVASNELTDSYSIMRQGLFVTNHVAFSRAMAKLNKKEASHDFLEYLSLAPIEELRQLNMTTVDVLACSEILTHLVVHPPEISDSRLPILFHFSVSRNAALAELARNVIDSYLPAQGPILASLLIKLPPWMQLAYIEGVRRKYTTIGGLFLKEIKKISAQSDVVDELSRVIR